MKRKLLYRVVPHNGGVVFAEPERAGFIARIHMAINVSKTWGEFRAAMPSSEYAKVIRDAFDCSGDAQPKDTDSFSGESVPGWSDGDYPPWLQQEMGGILPKSILEQYGERQNTWLNGDFWLIPEKNSPAICAALELSGWELESAMELTFH